MSDFFKIYIDRLGPGDKEKIEGEVSSDFLEVNENELQFRSPIALHLEAYLTSEHLILTITAETTAEMPCTICNQMTEVPLQLEKSYHTVDLSQLKEPIYDVREMVREQLLLELPHFIECKGKCPERRDVEKFLKHEEESDSGENYYPFSDLE